MDKELDIKLQELDKMLEGHKERLVIAGGVAMLMRNLITRPTKDIDCLESISDEVAFLEEVRKKIKELSINKRALYTFLESFGSWEKDIRPVERYSHFENLKIYTISEERLFVSRLWSDKKTDDIEAMIDNYNFNKEKFEDIMIEVHGYAKYTFPRPFKENEYLVKKLYIKEGWEYEKSDIKKLYTE